MNTRKLMVQAIREANRKGTNPYDNQPAYAREFEKVWKRAAGITARREAEDRASFAKMIDDRDDANWASFAKILDDRDDADFEATFT